jgi:hypothetical protein
VSEQQPFLAPPVEPSLELEIMTALSIIDKLVDAAVIAPPRPAGWTSTNLFGGAERIAGELGHPPRYCDLPQHNAQTAFRARRRRAVGGELEGDDPDQAGGERPVSRRACDAREVSERIVVARRLAVQVARP